MESEHHRGNAVILMYHRIADESTELCVPPEQFRNHLAVLRQEGYRVLPLRELARALQQGDVPEKAIAITLDDGYLDALTHAAPALQEFQFPATFFVVTSTLDGPSEFWWETLERVFAHDGLPPVLDVALPAGVPSMPTKTLQERLAAFDAVRCEFYPLPLEQRRERIEALLRWSGFSPAADALTARALTPEEVRTLSQLPGMEIGSHSENHLLLPAHSIDTKKREIFLGKQRLEALLGHDIHSFSYPHGAFDRESVELARQAGFALAVTTGNQQATLQSHPLVLPRCGVQAGDDLSLRLKILFAAEPQELHRRTHA
jgi:peptidoglycan/xylan/chitin deacetylase (PgdA/CDA1 family)